MTQYAFCTTLGLAERTFRSWSKRPPPPECPPDPPLPQAPDRAHRGRFDLTAVPPGVELTLDTTDLDLFDVPLKLIAAQDPGRRDEELYEAFHLDVVEDAHRVAAVVDAATRHRSFALAVTDQGTPYCAHEAQQAYVARALEHAPTKEAAPTQKAPLERSFRTLKALLAPLAAVTSMLAARLPSLRSEDLAKTVGRYLVTLAVDAYRIGAASRTTRAGAPLDRAAVHAAAEEWVQRRRTDHGSCKLLLARIHEEYRMDGPRDDFVRAFRRYELEDIEEADRRLRAAACRCHARICDRYFAGILRRVAKEGDQRRHRQRLAARDAAQRTAAAQRRDIEHQRMLNDPEYAISRGLSKLARSWRPVTDTGIDDARGLDYEYVLLRNALTALRSRHSRTIWRDAAEACWRRWLATTTADHVMCHAVRYVWDRIVEELFEESERDFSATARVVIIESPPLTSNPRSPP